MRSTGTWLLLMTTVTTAALAKPSKDVPGWLESWVAPSTARITPQVVPASSSARARVLAVRGETESFYVVLRSEAGVGETKWSWSEPKGKAGTLPGDSVKIFRVGFREGSEEPVADALVPLGLSLKSGGRGFSVEERPGENVPFWVEVHVPRDTRPGSYTTELRIALADARQVRVPVEIEVLPPTLPALGLLQSAFELDGASSTSKGPAYLRGAFEHRLSLRGRGVPLPEHKVVAGEGALALDPAAFERDLAPLLTGVPELDGLQLSTLELRAPAGMRGMERFKYLLAFEQHLRERGWGNRLVTFDAKGQMGSEVPAVQSADWLGCRLAASQNPNPQRAPGVRQWWQLPAKGPVSLDVGAEPLGMRALGWLAYRAGVTGIRADADSTRALFYEGEALFPSVRLKLLRDGIEEYELLRQAEHAGAGVEARRLAQELARSPSAVNEDAAHFDAAKRLLAHRVGAR